MSGIVFFLLRLICRIRGHRGDRSGLATVRRVGRDHWAICARCGGQWFHICRDPELEISIGVNTAPLRRALERAKDGIDAIAFAIGGRDLELERQKNEALRKWFGREHL